MYYFFDFHGRYLGFVSVDGEFFDPTGEPWGRLRGQTVVDPLGRQRGHLDAQGCFFNNEGSPLGYLRGWTVVEPQRARAVNGVGQD